MKSAFSFILGCFLFGASLGFSSMAQARCYGNDQQTSVTQRTDRISCTTHGFCNAYGYNPRTRRYENYYGSHPNCPGDQQRVVTTYHCLNSQGVGYTVDIYGAWQTCRAR